MRYKLFHILIVLTAILTSCSGDKMSEQTNKFPSINDVPSSACEKLSQKKIYFGHQSVGFNMIVGIKELMKEYPQIKLNIVETTDPSKFDTGIFAHSRVGKNLDPKSKIESFAANIGNGIGDKVDIAFIKFCYVDVGKKTDVNGLFEDYREKISQLEKAFQNTTFVHLTVPLHETKLSWKTKLKTILGKTNLWEYAGNVEKNEYNDLLIKYYKGKEPVFDLAKIESTFPDGSRSFFKIKGKRYYSLVPEYTNDGGHLNEKGSKIVAEQLLILLTSLQ